MNTKTQKINIHIVIQIILFVVLIAADRFTKYLAVTHLKGQEPVPVIKDIIELRYLENSGAAFGMFQNMQWMFYIITVIVMAVIIVMWVLLNRRLRTYIQLPTQTDNNSKIYFRKKTYSNVIFLNYMLAALAAGAVGNLIDRLAQKYVVDFIYFRIIDFPIFNFADICVTVTAVLLIIFFIFIYKDDPGFIIFKKKSDETDNIQNS